MRHVVMSPAIQERRLREAQASVKIAEALDETGLTPLGQARLLSELATQILNRVTRRQGVKVERRSDAEYDGLIGTL